MSSKDLGTLLPLLLIVLAFWVLVIRPARKRQQAMSQIQNSVDVGSEVMLGSGIFGTVVAVGDETLTLRIAPGTEIKVARQAVVRVIESHGSGEGPGSAAGPTDEPGTDFPQQPQP
ncbi:MAG TPA: preprotein translocase subunit YajC [Nocardioidaceae bacterium]|nr:preprotein translocase subunit YajC [Nocardioidaceae bacterium]